MSNSITPKLPRVLPFILVALLAFLVGRQLSPSADPTEEPGPSVAAEHAEEAPSAPEVWTCSMHPQIRMAEPGKCPICGMDLILADSAGGDGDAGISELRMSPAAMQRAKIRTAKVELRNLAHEIPLVGKVSLDETRVATITSWVSGRLDRLFVDYTGTEVRPGDHLAEIYSPTLFSAQEELLQAIEAVKRVQGSDLDLLRESTLKTVESARERLRLFGLKDTQIQAIEERGVPDEHMTLNAPIGGVVIHKKALEGMFVSEGSEIVKIADLSKVWVTLDAYEADLAWLRYGQLVSFTVEAYPGQYFEGRIAFIDPVLDPHTRSVKVRLNVDNADRRLKPDMFVSATAEALLSSTGRVVDAALAGLWMCPMHPEVTGDGPGECSECGMPLEPVEDLGFTVDQEDALSLAIPDTAPMFTGRRSVVYVQLPNHEMPSFEGREVLLGPHADGYYVVLDGLAAGEDVVVNGNFKIDSELQIRAKRSMMAPDVGRSGSQPTSPPVAGPPLSVPVEFQEGLGRVLQGYLGLVDGLAEDQLDAQGQKEISAAFEALDMGILKGRTHRAWMQAVGGLRTGVEAVSAARTLGEAREALGALSTHLMAAIKAFGAETHGAELAVFHCPMAYDMAGADWIAPAGPTRNPYFGLDMQKCGDVTGPLQQPASVSSAPVDLDKGAPDPGMDGMKMEDAQGSVSPGFQEQLGALVDAYLSMEEGLTKDVDSDAVRAGLRAAFDEIDMEGVKGDSHMAWMKGSPALAAAIDTLIAAQDIDGARAAVAPLSEQLVLAIERFGLPESEKRELAVFHCPMAFDFEGADWLGASGPVANPFFGSEMSSCGKQVRLLGKGEER